LAYWKKSENPGNGRKLRFFYGTMAAAMLASSAYALEAKDGRMKLVVDERSGRFSLQYLANVATNRYVPLLYAQETRTTYPTLMVDQKIYRLGEASEFRVTVSKIDAGGVKVEYRSAFCTVRQTFTFVASQNSAMADGVTIGFEIENISQKDSKIGLRFLLDTWLGEKSSAHFASSSSGALTAETELGADYPDVWVRSAEDLGASISTDAQVVGSAIFQVILAAPATRPDKVVIANWKRLNDTDWAFTVNRSRNFTLLPYSINDSAVALYYEPSELRPGSTKSIVAVLGQANSGYVPTATSGPETASLYASIAPSESAPLNEMADLIAVRSVLDALNKGFDSGTPLSADDLAALKETLERLETRKSKY